MYARVSASIATPIGTVILTGGDDSLHRITIGESAILPTGSSAALREAIAQLKAYFAGTLVRFDLPLAPASTPRGTALRQAIVAIGHAETVSYGTLARGVGSSPRAIGQACARNPLPIVVPCHRVLAAGGILGAYSAGDGPDTKRWLLDFERRHGETE